MSDASVAVPEGYEIVRTISTSESVGEYIVRHQAENVLVRLRIFNFTTAAGATTRRHSREHLRSDITFMEELEQPGIIRIFDYSDTKNLFWIATLPAEVDKLFECFDFLASQPLQFRQMLVYQFLAVLQRIHNSHVVHRNLSSDAVFLTPEHEIYIGDFGLASYLTDRPTIRLETTIVTTTSYLPPEVRNADTFICNVSSDIFSAGLLVFEILSATALPKDKPDQINEILHFRLNEQVADGTISSSIAEAILKAAHPSPQKRWSTAEGFANALKTSGQKKSAHRTTSVDESATMAIADSAEPVEATSEHATTEVAQPSQPATKAFETADTITPLDTSHEIWNSHYEILEKIGEGGQAVVYKAYDHLTNEEIAIKTIWSRHRGDRAAINRLKQGAMIARSLTHRHIIKTYSVEQRTDADSLGKYVFICMELIGSQLDLANVIETRKNAGKKISLDETLHIIRQLLDALMYAHEYTIHRDIKPGNIMLVRRDGQTADDTSDLTKFDIKLIDFGIAKVLSQKHIDVTGKGFRSAYYGAPELADTRTGVDARADIYSVGVIMYQMLTGNIPRKGSPPANKVNKNVPAALAKVIDRAISTDREKRFKVVSEFTKEIERAVSKFNWVRKAAKVAAVLLIGTCTAAAAKYFLPEPERLPVRQSMELLQNRSPDIEIASLANAAIVRYSDIEGYNSYDSLRQEALGGLKTAEDLGTDTFKPSYSPWKKQEEVWFEVEPAVKKIERIAKDQKEYNAREDLAVVDLLMTLEPSSKIVSEVTEKAQKAETLLEERPIARNTLNICADSYDLAANVYVNIQELAGDSDAPETAEQINTELKNVGQLREASLFSRQAIETVEQLKDSGFQERNAKCFDKADRYYNTFELRTATKYYDLLGQICGTMANVRDQVDFSRSDIGLISSRLMDLCYEDVETFENYPTWKERLEYVYKKKDIAAKYTLIRNLLVKGPRDVPLTIYDLVSSALQQYRQNDLDSAAAELIDAIEQYKEFMLEKIDKLIADCGTLSTFSTVSAEKIGNSKNAFEKLSNSLIESPWPPVDFADEYNRYWQQITEEKQALREQLAGNARQLRKNIIDSKNKAQQQSFFWESQHIDKYVAVARQYDSDDIAAGIANWKYVEDLSRLSAILNQMKTIDLLLDKMLARKGQLDDLAADIDEAIAFCQRFKGISSEEKEKYEQWESDLKQLRYKLTAPQDNVYLIDQSEEAFAANYGDIQSAFSEIRAQLPYHRNRVIELINKTHSLEKTADHIGRLHQNWSIVLADSVSLEIKSDPRLLLAGTRDYLESVKEDVDNWPPERFNRQMRDRCNVLADALGKQDRIVASITSAVLSEKIRLIEAIESFEKRVNEILSDGDIRMLEALAAADERQSLRRFRQLPNLLGLTRQKLTNIVLESVSASASSLPENSTADFEVDTWLIAFNTKEAQLDAHISQLQAIQDTVSIFQETRELLSQQSSTETEYYIGLRDYTVGLIDYSDISGKIDAVTADNATVEMCSFLEQMEDDTVPRLKDIITTVAEIGKELANLKSAKISTLTEAKDFNKKRQQLLGRIAALREDLQKLDRTNIEDTCKEAIDNAMSRIKNLIGSSNQNAKLSKLTSSLWAFYPDHRNWEQWLGFLQLYHIAVFNEDIFLSSSGLLRVVNEKGDYLKLTEIAANPTEVFSSDMTNAANFGWPRHIGHQKDPTVIFAFIPGTASAGIGPFYMATREISNAQYRLFMEEIEAKLATKLAGWSYFSDQNNKLLIGQAQGQFPPCRITWDETASVFVSDKNFENAPVTWVTSGGARAYAEWLGAQLPTAAQHTYATRTGTNTTYPWGDELSNAVSYAHLRSVAWQNAARDYNAKRDDPVQIAYPPVGAVKDFLREEALDPANIAHSENNNHPVWPYFTENNKPNAWGLYDMLGNVWEWCTDMQNNSEPVICGGSCLSPPEYISPASKYEFKAQACDVGFRIVIATK